MNQRKEAYYDDQMVLLWELHHERDLEELDFTVFAKEVRQ